mmetsp:Transcript_40006/g.72024  ORF Transcript_40006/g.72024 Transcript_40006/m.72024 type:complete len:146 (+) Transcript_40006:44-481(+)
MGSNCSSTLIALKKLGLNFWKTQKPPKRILTCTVYTKAPARGGGGQKTKPTVCGRHACAHPTYPHQLENLKQKPPPRRMREKKKTKCGKPAVGEAKCAYLILSCNFRNFTQTSSKMTYSQKLLRPVIQSTYENILTCLNGNNRAV